MGPFESGFHPIKIHIEYLGSIRDSPQTRFIKEVTVPHVQRIVSRVFQVRDHKDKLLVDSMKCIYSGIPSKVVAEGLGVVDLVAFVEISTECKPLTLMSTTICQYDGLVERPQVGRIHICESWLKTEWLQDTPKKQTRIMQTSLHEFIHLLGFHYLQSNDFENLEASLKRDSLTYLETSRFTPAKSIQLQEDLKLPGTWTIIR